MSNISIYAIYIIILYITVVIRSDRIDSTRLLNRDQEWQW